MEKEKGLKENVGKGFMVQISGKQRKEWSLETQSLNEKAGTSLLAQKEARPQDLLFLQR